MKFAVIGAKGQVGQEFAKILPPDRMVALGSGDLDVISRESVRNCLNRLDFDVVINLAAFHNVNGCEDEPDTAFAVNATGAYNVALTASEMGKKVVFFSSDYVFGSEKERSQAYVETDSPSPLNLYGVSKIAGEHLVRAAAPDNHLIVRSSSLYGCVTSKKGWTFPEMMLNKARAGEKLRIVSDQVMAPTYTRDLTSRVLELVEKKATGTFHVANAGSCSWYEFACATFDLVGLRVAAEAVSSDEFPAKAARPNYSVLASVREKEVNLEPLQSWHDALKAYLTEKGEIE